MRLRVPDFAGKRVVLAQIQKARWAQEQARTPVLVLACLCAPILCIGQEVILPQCPSFAGNPQLSASCFNTVSDLAFDSNGTGWIADNTNYTPGRVLRLPNLRVGQIPSSNQTADLVLGKPDFSSLMNGSCEACSIDRPVKLAFDSNGALWVADLPSAFAQPAKIHRFSPPFTNGQAADLVFAADATGGMVFDANGNLWIASIYACGRVLEFTKPFSSSLQPAIVLGQPSATACVQNPASNVLSGVQGIAFAPDGSLFVGDFASNRVAVFKPPFQTFMTPAIAIGQVNLTNYLVVPFDQGGTGYVADLAFDPNGRLWLVGNSIVSLYKPPFSTGMARTSWFNFLTGQQSNGGAFPFTFHGYAHLRFASDASLWFSGTGNAIAVLTPSELALATLMPTISIVGSSATGSSPFTANQLISIYGSQLGPTSGSGAQVGTDGAVTKSNAGTQVLFDGVPGPILYTSATQINTAIPCAVAGHASTQMVVSYQSAQSAPFTLPLAQAAPGIFTLSGSGTGPAAALNQDNSLNGASNPAARGSAVTFYATGIGATSPCIDGQIFQTNFPQPTSPVVAGVGNIGAQVLYAGQAPFLMSGVAQINIVVPSNAPTGVVPLALLIGNAFSQPGATIAVK